MSYPLWWRWWIVCDACAGGAEEHATCGEVLEGIRHVLKVLVMTLLTMLMMPELLEGVCCVLLCIGGHALCAAGNGGHACPSGGGGHARGRLLVRSCSIRWRWRICTMLEEVEDVLCLKVLVLEVMRCVLLRMHNGLDSGPKPSSHVHGPILWWLIRRTLSRSDREKRR